MRESDFQPFVAMLDQVCGLLSRGQHKPDSQASALWFRSLAAYDLDAVRAAFDAHVKDPERGRFVPTPAGIIAKLNAKGRPSANEAWAIALRAQDERQDLRWTDDIADAWGIAKPVLDGGDEVGARMAFREAYERICGERSAQPVRWWTSIGTESKVIEYDASGEPLLLEGPLQDLPKLFANAPPQAREKLIALAERLRSQPSGDAYVPNPDIARTADLKARAQALTDAYQAAHPQPQPDGAPA